MRFKCKDSNVSIMPSVLKVTFEYEFYNVCYCFLCMIIFLIEIVLNISYMKNISAIFLNCLIFLYIIYF